MSSSSSSSSSSLQRKELRVEVLKTKREEKRKRIQDLFEQQRLIQEQMKEVENDLEQLDTEIDQLETDIQTSQQQQQQQQKKKSIAVVSERKNEIVIKEERSVFSPTQPGEILTEPTQHDEILSQQQQRSPAAADDDENERISQHHEDYDYNNFENYRPPSRASSVGQLEISTRQPQPRKKPPPLPSAQAAGEPSQSTFNIENNNTFPWEPSSAAAAVAAAAPAVGTERRKPTGTLDDFVIASASKNSNTAGASSSSAAAASSIAVARAPQPRQQADTSFAAARGQTFSNSLASTGHEHFRQDTFPWSAQVNHVLRNTFRINSFRDHQKEIINATMSGQDVFVIMRTGGGKSLTYQLPALIEGRGPQKKVTFVISPLLSLIQDQEDQMNQLAPGSAISFTSGMKGGATEHARRWGLVRDPSQGVCLVFVTPEKVSQSNKLCSEMEKLFAQNRLGRFVIDECHCACQWGHDFRPDYTKLGKLKSHFPSVPVIAVTATASERVKDDVCSILRLGSNYRYFRSTANRPNLTYSVRPKPDGKGAVIAAMAEFIKERHPRNAGIVYTLSRKDADTVASDLCDFGIVARAYHSDVSATRKEQIHRSWMRNETQVVVATIAFGLGINKPDVSFVLHHSISKTLEAYYQESGRAGRDGNPADCVLFYSPKDTHRMLKMVHGSSSEQLLWPMVRYAQQSGNDAVCRAIIMTHLGEPNCPDVLEVCRRNDGITTNRRDVGKHAQTAIRLLTLRLQEGRDITSAMLVKDWRMKSDKAPQCVRDNPPADDGLSVDDCERIIISLLLEGIIKVTPQWTAYDTVIYLDLVPGIAERFSASREPRFVINLPKRDTPEKSSTSKASKQAKSRKSVANEGEWLSSKSKPAKRKKAATAKGKTVKKAKTASKSKSKPKLAAKKATSNKKAVQSANPIEVIELSSDDDEKDRKPSADDIFVDSETEEEEWMG